MSVHEDSSFNFRFRGPLFTRPEALTIVRYSENQLENLERMTFTIEWSFMACAQTTG
jgi:hypothetical protein